VAAASQVRLNSVWGAEAAGPGLRLSGQVTSFPPFLSRRLQTDRAKAELWEAGILQDRANPWC